MPPSFLRQWLRLLVYQGAGLIMAMGTVALAAVAVPPAVYGQYGLMLSIVQASSGIGLLWLQSGLLRYGREEVRACGTANDTVAAVLVLAMAVFVPALALAWALSPRLSVWTGLPPGFLAIVAPCLVAFAAFETVSYAAQVRGRLDGYAGGQLLARSGPLAGVIALLLGLAGGADALMAFAALGWAGAAIWTGRAAFAGGFAPTSHWRRQALRLVAYGWLLPVSVLASMLTQWMGLWLVRAHVGLADAGVLLWAMGVFALLTGVMQPLGAVLAPRMIDLRLAGDEQQVRYRLEVILAAGLLLAALAPAGIAAVKLGAGLLLPAAYASARSLIVVLLASVPALLVASALSPLLAAYESIVPRVVALNVAICLCHLALLTVLVPTFGALGAAIASVITGIANAFGILTFAIVTAARAQAVPVLARQALIAAVPASAGLGLAAVDGAGLTGAALVTSVVSLAAGRRAGIFRPLVAMRPHLEGTAAARIPGLLRLFIWITADKTSSHRGASR